MLHRADDRAKNRDPQREAREITLANPRRRPLTSPSAPVPSTVSASHPSGSLPNSLSNSLSNSLNNSLPNSLLNSLPNSPFKSLVALVIAVVCLFEFPALAYGQESTTKRSKAGPPNIILMLSDDQGWSGLSVAMHPEYPGSKGSVFQTPNLERFAAQGMRFSSGYAPAPVCSPTRISIQTGKSPAQLHWTKAAPPETGRKLIEPSLIKRIADSETTIGELLRTAGYATAHYGKWHISGGGPGAHGYDEHDGDTGNENAYQFTDPNPVDIFGMAQRSENFMARCQQAGKPFYIQLSWNALHASENALNATKAKYERLNGNMGGGGGAGGGGGKQIATAAITEDLDTGVGRVLAAIDRLGLAENTYVIYTSDNGAGGGRREGLNGGKGSVWEGGVRVPLIVRGPGVPANSWCHSPVVGYDFLPTFAEWAGLTARSMPKGIEGGSFAPLLRPSGATATVRRPREELVFHFPHYQSNDGPHSAIRVGSMKLIYFYETGSSSLFDLSRDIGERSDLAADSPQEVLRLRRKLEQYLTAVNAQFPTPNPQFDPANPAAPQRKKMGGNKGKKMNERKAAA
jgi:arylsulfatase A-like enzyme